MSPEMSQKHWKACHSVVGTVRCQLRHLDITGPGLKWDCTDGFQQQCYPLLAAWVSDYKEQVVVAQVWYGTCPMCEIPKGVPIGHWTVRTLENSRDQHTYWQLLEGNNIDALHTLGVHPMHNQFWKYPLCNVYRLWQPDELHQLLLGLVKDLVHWLLQYLNARNVMINFTIDSHCCRHIPASSTSLNHSIYWKVAPGKAKRSVEWSEHWQWIALQFLTAPRTTGKLHQKQPPMKWWWEQCGYYVDSLYLSTSKITRIYPLKNQMMHSSDFARRWVLFVNRNCRSLRRAMWITCWQKTPFSYANNRFIGFVLQWRLLCMGWNDFNGKTQANSGAPG